MNLVMRGIPPDNIVTQNGDALENDGIPTIIMVLNQKWASTDVQIIVNWKILMWKRLLRNTLMMYGQKL